MTTKHIDNLRIVNFRGFDDLNLEGLGAVNLIVGQNNCGKTSLLEAITLACSPSSLGDLPRLFRSIDGDPNKRFYPWLLKDGSENAMGEITAKGPDLNQSLSFHQSKSSATPDHGKCIFQSARLHAYARNRISDLRIRVTSVLNRNPSELVRGFGDAVRPREGEELVHKILRKVDPRILRVRVDPVEEGNIISVDLGLSESIPLSQAGQGIIRLVAILSELIGEKPQVCIIDEIENGIHHAALKQVWRGLAEVSETLGVQVFATTHSKECLEAAHEVFFTEDPDNRRDFALIQLLRVNEKVVGKVLTEETVEAAFENDIELR